MTIESDPGRHERARATVEGRLERMRAAEPPPTLRHRVLMAVDDVLVERRPTAHDAGEVMAPVWALAAAAMLLLGLSLVAVTQPVRPFEPLTLAERLRVAGVVDEDLVAAAKFARPSEVGHLLARRTDHVPVMPAAIRMLDVRRLLEEEL